MVARLTVVIILKCTDIVNHYVVHLEMTQRCRSIKLQKRSNRQSKSQKKRSDLCLPEEGAGRRWKWTKAVKRYKLPVIKINKY